MTNILVKFKDNWDRVVNTAAWILKGYIFKSCLSNRKDTKPLYHSFLYSLVSLLPGIYPLPAMHLLLVTLTLGNQGSHIELMGSIEKHCAPLAQRESLRAHVRIMSVLTSLLLVLGQCKTILAYETPCSVSLAIRQSPYTKGYRTPPRNKG